LLALLDSNPYIVKVLDSDPDLNVEYMDPQHSTNSCIVGDSGSALIRIFFPIRIHIRTDLTDRIRIRNHLTGYDINVDDQAFSKKKNVIPNKDNIFDILCSILYF